MPGILIKITPNQLPAIQKNTVVKVANTDFIRQLKLRRRETPEDFAIIGIQETGENRFVIMTARLKSITSNQQGLNLVYVRTFPQKDKWLLPKGYAESWNFQQEGCEFLGDEQDELACLVRNPELLFRNAGPQLPAGFKWNPLAASNLIITFGPKGVPILYSRKAFEQQTLGCFDKYTDALSQVWPKITGRDFEIAMKELFEDLGFHVVQSEAGGDGGVDLTLTRGDKTLGLDKYVVQCKNFQRHRKVDSAVVTHLQGTAAAEAAQRGLVITTSSFTKDAQKAAERGVIPIQLIDAKLLAALVLPRVQELPTVLRFLI